ncbi:uncharacterized protein TNCV_294681 [Trichonephila clavipes]|nr:uncharacterized protein TNCV_294681 [Trichonephila clavipes]
MTRRKWYTHDFLAETQKLLEKASTSKDAGLTPPTKRMSNIRKYPGHRRQCSRPGPRRSRRVLCKQYSSYGPRGVAVVAEWYRYRAVAVIVTSSSPVPLKTRRVGQRCTFNLSRAETSSRWCGVVVRRRGAGSGVVHVT